MVSGRSRCLPLDLDDFTLCRCKPQPAEGGICGPRRGAHTRWGLPAPGEVAPCVARGTAGLAAHTRLHKLTLSLPIGRGIAV